MKKKNCNAGCKKCGEQNAHYTIENGSFLYTCLSCGTTGNGSKFTAHKPVLVGHIYE